ETPPIQLVVSASPDLIRSFISGYQKDPAFKEKWTRKPRSLDPWYPGQCYYRDQQGLLFFRDADFLPKLCVPRSMRAQLLRHHHESPYISAHAG
ncbi:hypothetical protein SISSUDRAFT_975703, partial [Sistotremastrum suecicum HHB10207 ss-3]